MVSLPLWAVFTVSFGTPLLAFVGVIITLEASRRIAGESSRLSRREETMRHLRWASELAVHSDERMAKLGVGQLNALLGSHLLDQAWEVLAEEALDAVYEDEVAELAQIGEDSEAIHVLTSDDATIPGRYDENESGGADYD